MLCKDSGATLGQQYSGKFVKDTECTTLASCCALLCGAEAGVQGQHGLVKAWSLPQRPLVPSNSMIRS